jgi:AcrR family transcriptional regulator
MKVKKNDRRVDRTRHALKEALYELLKEKSYESVTVEEITERANLGRTTFYLHYKDKEDLLLEDFIELVDRLVERMINIPLLQWIEGQLEAGQHTNQPQAIYMVFQHAEAHAKLYRIVLRGQGMSEVTGPGKPGHFLRYSFGCHRLLFRRFPHGAGHLVARQRYALSARADGPVFPAPVLPGFAQGGSLCSDGIIVLRKGFFSFKCRHPVAA